MKRISCSQPGLALLMTLLLATALALPVAGAPAGVVFTSLYSFTGTNDGSSPYAGLVQGSDGNFYGTTFGGGTNNLGTVFQITSTGALTSLYSFGGTNDGANPVGGLVQGSDGNFYGTTEAGGTNNLGTVFKITTSGALTSLYSFTGTNDGANPYAPLAQGSDGNYYGTTELGGTNNFGTVFKISTNGALTSLYSFTSGSDGAYPLAGLVQGSDGNFYGSTAGEAFMFANAVFQISTNGTLNALYASFPPFGGNSSRLAQGGDGFFYGTTQYGGTSSDGTVFKISTNGPPTTLHSFSLADGLTSFGGLVLGSDGSFYGTTYGGGNTNLNNGFGYGTVFKVTTNGALAGLYSFGGTNDGANPQAGLVQGSDGSFYGTTKAGGTNNLGTVFQLTIEPQLSITRSGANVILTWPTNYTGYVVQETSDLTSSSGWAVNDPFPPVIVNGQYSVTRPKLGPHISYRLKRLQ
jgi:uncharacterized repeat protein (TIGR03803 family)